MDHHQPESTGKVVSLPYYKSCIKSVCVRGGNELERVCYLGRFYQVKVETQLRSVRFYRHNSNVIIDIFLC